VEREIQVANSTKRVIIEFDSPVLNGARFLEHSFDRATRKSSKRVVAASGSLLYLSEDLGDSWRCLPIDGIKTIQNAFTLQNGDILVSGFDERDASNNRLSLIRGSSTISSEIVGKSGWHATFSIDQSDDCIMFSEYPTNPKGSKEHDDETDARVFRSMDGGITWEVVFSVGFPDIRHFHTCTFFPDSNSWVITSGDTPEQSRFWNSFDNGESWSEVTDSNPDSSGEVENPQSMHRTVVMHEHEGKYIWATDDILGRLSGYDRGYECIEWLPIPGANQYRVLIRNYTTNQLVSKNIIEPEQGCSFIFDWEGVEIDHDLRFRVQYRDRESSGWRDSSEYSTISRDFRWSKTRLLMNEGRMKTRSKLVSSEKVGGISMEEICDLGMHIRSMIDVGFGYVLFSEAKYVDIAPNPQVFLILKEEIDNPHLLMNIPNERKQVTGVTYSRSSIKDHNGVFFTQIEKGLIFENTEIVRWKITIE